MAKAIYPGSFDPLTNGHLDILNRGLGLFSEITVLVAENDKKSPLIEVKDRIKLIEDVLKDMPETKAIDGTSGQSRVKVESWDGLIMDYAKANGFTAVIRGLRAASDFEYEFMMATMNKSLNADVETVFLMTSQNLFFVSSSMIKELLNYGGDVSQYVPRQVLERLKK